MMTNLSEKAPKNLYLTKGHEWAKVEDSEVRIGITEQVQKERGSILSIELPDVGKKFEQGDKLAALESSESVPMVYIPLTVVSSVHAPLSGRVIQVNGELEDNPELLNEDPFGVWIGVLSPSDLEKELDILMDVSEYEEFIKSGQ